MPTKERKDTAYALILKFADGTRKRLTIEAQGLLSAVRASRAFHPTSRVTGVRLDKRQHA